MAAFGIYRALYIPGMLIGPPEPLLLIGFLLQAVFGIVAGVGVWRGARWASLVILLLGASIAATALIEVVLSPPSTSCRRTWPFTCLAMCCTRFSGRT